MVGACGRESQSTTQKLRRGRGEEGEEEKEKGRREGWKDKGI